MICCFDPPGFALEWCRRLGVNLDTLVPLSGGINNQVFSCRANERHFVLKGYVADRTDSNDRFIAEVSFLNYANEVATEFVPLLLYSDAKLKSVVLECLEGEPFVEGSNPSKEDIKRAIAFMRRLNTDQMAAKDHNITSASEGFLCLTDHLSNLNERIVNMGSEHLPVSLQNQAKFILDSLKHQYEYLRLKTLKIISTGQCVDALNQNELCVSPSDFGFHNAIRTPIGLKFFDFEFAGWDDPAKAVADFDLQPKVPVIQRKRELLKALPFWSSQIEERCEVLFPIMQLKWACIILSVLDPNRWMQISQIIGLNHIESLLQLKLQLAQTYLTKD